MTWPCDTPAAPSTAEALPRARVDLPDREPCCLPAPILAAAGVGAPRCATARKRTSRRPTQWPSPAGGPRRWRAVAGQGKARRGEAQPD
eukprot:scaffold1044_cov332-Prasinococcus_capsulatus_cf.AAC.4